MSVVINGSAGVTTNSGAVYNGISAGTAVASTSGTSIDFTSIPPWVKRITVMLNGVSLSGTSHFLFQIGAGSVDTTSYVGQSNAMPGGGATVGITPTTGFGVYSGNAGNIFSGSATITLVGSNMWVCAATFAAPANFVISVSGGTKTLSGSLDRIRITTVNGTDTFDAGSINILYE